MTLDQQLYRVPVCMQWVYSKEFENVVIMLGGMLMSFCWSTGSLLQGNGFSEILSSIFGGVGKMLTGKKLTTKCWTFPNIC